MDSPVPASVRPSGGIGHYLRDLVYGASDGAVTTLAVLAGTTGAAFEPRVGLVLGVANLAADGLSMGASNYLGMKSELQQTGSDVAAEQPWRHGLATALAFVVAGAFPLLAYGVVQSLWQQGFGAALAVAVLTLAGTGVLRARFIETPAWRSAAEMVAVAGGAAAAAYGIGALANYAVG